MARALDHTQSEYLIREEAPVTEYPFVMACRFRIEVNVTSSTSGIMEVRDKSATKYVHSLWFSTTEDKCYIETRNNANRNYAKCAQVIADVTWYHICGLFVSATDRRILINAANKNTNSGNLTLVNLDRFILGAFGRDPVEAHLTGQIAEAAIWDLWYLPGATASDQADYFEANILPGLVAEERPSVYPNGLIAYWDLVSDDDDKRGGYDLTPINTPSWAQHPDVLCSVPEETTQAEDTQSCAGNFLAAISEDAGATDTQSCIANFNTAISESASAEDVVNGLRVLVAGLAETTNAADLVDRSLLLLASIAENTNVSEVQDSLRVLVANLTESATAFDLQSCAGIFPVIISESVNAADLVNGMRILTGSIIEAAIATDVGYIIYIEIPPFMQQHLIDPYSGGAWLWLVQIAIPGQATVRIARNTEDVPYDGNDFDKFNLQIGEQIFSGDGSIPRVTMRVAQDVNRKIENLVNETEGALGAAVRLIRVNEKYLSSTVKALEFDYENLASESDTEWVTFTLGVPNPLTQRFPLQMFSSSMCPEATPSLFGGPRCQYDKSAPEADQVCTGTFEDCYGKGNAVHWGGELGLDPSVVEKVYL